MPHSRNIGKVSSNGQGEATKSNCYRCGKSAHKAAQCPFRTAKCHNCGKTGHLRRVCRQPKPPKHPGAQRSRNRQKVQLVEEDVNSEILVLYHDKASSDKPLEVDLQLERKPLWMEVDTGAAVSLVSEETDLLEPVPYVYNYTHPTKLCTYSGEPLTVLGQQEVKVQHGEQTAKLPLLVVQGKGPSLLGRNWLRVLRLDWKVIHQLRGGSLQELLERHGEVFQAELGTLRGYEAKIHVDPGAKP